MMPFHRRHAPAFWLEKERQWLDSLNREQWAAADRDPLRRQHEGKTLATHFHESVRHGDERLCAYCDGALLETTPETVDHFLPRTPRGGFPVLALHWDNLFPACQLCNSAKRDRWSCAILRPDLDLSSNESDLSAFGRWFALDEITGKLSPAPEQKNRHLRYRIWRTIRLFRLNRPHRCKARSRERRMLVGLDDEWLDLICREGPYRFIAQLIRAGRQSSPLRE